jgi:hypothetical protein
MGKEGDIEQGPIAGIVSQFPIGQLLITPMAEEALTREEIFYGLARHCAGDWGDLDEMDWKANDEALMCHGRLLSQYSTSRGTRFWIITEGDRSITTILIPIEH